MDYAVELTELIDVDRAFLDLRNPRHEPFEDQDEAIEYLCREEQVLPLAQDIAEHGLNPLELFALIADGDNAYFSAEGNRRLCALKLLNDPDLSPANQRSDFEETTSGWSPIKQLSAIVFKDREEITPLQPRPFSCLPAPLHGQRLLLMASLSVCLATVRAFCFDLSTSKRVILYCLRPTSWIGRLPQQP